MAEAQAYQYVPNVPPRAGLWQSPELLKNLELRTVPKPGPPPPHHSLVRVHACALNARDLMVIASDPIYPLPTSPNLVPCSSAAGTISSTNDPASSSPLRPGDRVLLHPNSWLHSVRDAHEYSFTSADGGGAVNGSLTQWKIVPNDYLIRIPDAIASFEEATAFETSGITGFNAVAFSPYPELRAAPGVTVLTLGTGGVSCGAIQSAAALGARVISTTSSPAKEALCRRLGAAEVVNYRTHPNWADEVLRLTGGKGVDVVVEVCGAGTLAQSLKATRAGGEVALCGILSGAGAEEGAGSVGELVSAVMFGGKTVRGIVGGGSRDMVRQMMELYAEKGVKESVVGRVFEWEEAREAFAYYLRGEGDGGKVVVRI